MDMRASQERSGKPKKRYAVLTKGHKLWRSNSAERGRLLGLRRSVCGKVNIGEASGR